LDSKGANVLDCRRASRQGKDFAVVTFEAGNKPCSLCFCFVMFPYGQAAIYPSEFYIAACQT
jgi:hypothetical protein